MPVFGCSHGAECGSVDERGPEWWLDEHRQWRQGTPPAGWHQGTDGRWRPAWNDPTEEIRTAEAPRHAAPRSDDDQPRWARIGVGALLGTTLLAVGVALALGSRGGDPEDASRESTTTSSNVTATTSSSGTDEGSTGSSPTTTTTSTPGKPPKHGPPSTEPGPDGPPATAPSGSDPLALCSPGQRALIERGNHPPSWYADRFDADHDGIYCE